MNSIKVIYHMLNKPFEKGLFILGKFGINLMNSM